MFNSHLRLGFGIRTNKHIQFCTVGKINIFPSLQKEKKLFPHLPCKGNLKKNNSGKQIFQLGYMVMKSKILLFPGAIPCCTWAASPGEWWGSAAGSRKICHIWSTGQKWPETLFLWNLNSQPNSALAKVHQNQSISINMNLFPCNTSVLTKRRSPHRSTLKIPGRFCSQDWAL